MTRCRVLSLTCSLLLGLALAPRSLADDPPPARPLTPEEAARRVGEQVTVRMEVRSAGKGQGVYFLNSEADFRDGKNFTLFIGRKAAEKFKEAKVEDPAAHFKDKTVLATGKVVLFRDKPEIAVEGPGQIKVAEKDGDKGGGKKE